MFSIRTTILIVILCSLNGFLVSAQQVDTSPPFRVQVFVDSAFVRVAPAREAQLAASIFEGDVLEAVGRNMDGRWFEVRRPGRAGNLGWVSDEFVSKSFLIELLPLTDATTGLVGPDPILDTGYAVFVQQASVLRDGPSLESGRLGVVPYGVSVPVIERNQDASWLHVNYLGNIGWISGFNVRITSFNLLDIPEGANLPPPLSAGLPIIPPELQLAQAARLREYLNTQFEMALNLQSFWWSVFLGEVMPCNPPAAITDYQYDVNDIRELPELRRIVPRLDTGVAHLNASIATLQVCGALETSDVISARNAAINAKVIFQAGLGSLNNVEENVIR